MKFHKLGNLKVSAVGLGCMGMSHAYGEPADKKEMKRLLAQAVDIGYTFFDTAEIYGTPENPHENEEIVGEALKSHRHKIVIATKFGLTFDKTSDTLPYPLVPNSRPEKIIKAVEGSLSRLKTDYIDLYYQHRPDPAVPVEEVAGIMLQLIKEGKILHWGLSEVDEAYIRRAHKICPLSAVQNRYHMMYRNYENLFPVLEELNIGFVPFSPLANGFLSGKYNADSTFNEKGDYRAVMPQFQKESYEQNRELLALLHNMAEEKNATPAQISLAWMICKKPWITPIPGTRKPERLIENAGAADILLSAEEIKQIDEALDKMQMSAVYGGAKTSLRHA